MRRSCAHFSIAAALACIAVTANGEISAYQFEYEYEDTPLEQSIIPDAVDLQQDAALARREGIPLMLAFSTAWCDYCRALEQQVLEPMIRSGDYEDRVVLRKLMVDDYNVLTGFDGNRISSTRLGHRAGVELYPTLVLFDSEGNEVSERIVGITVLDYVSLQIDEALARAKREINNASPGEK